ncbi:MAG: response regulator [Fulvivirga sp.]
MILQNIKILLADDDSSDCLLFRVALEELPLSASLTIVHNGEQVIEELNNKENHLPDVLFLDLNMPRKNGFATLGEIKRNTTLQNLPVILFTSVSDKESVKQVYKDAAHYYICKPDNFLELKKVIYKALTLINQINKSLPPKKNFTITADSIIFPDSTES